MRSDWLLSRHYFLVMTRHYEFFFRAKFAQDLGVIKTKTVSFSKKLFLLSLLVSITWPGFSLFSEHDLLRLQTDVGKRFQFFPVLKTPCDK